MCCGNPIAAPGNWYSDVRKMHLRGSSCPYATFQTFPYIPHMVKFSAFVFFSLCVFAPLREDNHAKAQRRKAQIHTARSIKYNPLNINSMKKICPHCGETFECRNHEIWNCDCARVRLTDEARMFLHLHYPDECLCTECLTKISNPEDLPTLCDFAALREE